MSIDNNTSENSPEWIKGWLSHAKHEINYKNNWTSITKRLIRCPMCAVSGLVDTDDLIAISMPDIFNHYVSVSKEIGHIDDENKSVQVLSAVIHDNIAYLNELKSESSNCYESYMSVARNLIEKLATLDFIIASKKRRTKLSELYTDNSYDICKFFSSNRIDIKDTIDKWKIQNEYWTSSKISHRIDLLENPEIELIYAYISRINHGLNRDSLLKYDEDKVYMMEYVYINSIILYNDVFTKSSTDICGVSISDKHIKLNNDIRAVWSKLKMPIYSILELTSFGTEEINYNEQSINFIKFYNKRMLETTKSCKLFPKINMK